MMVRKLTSLAGALMLGMAVSWTPSAGDAASLGLEAQDPVLDVLIAETGFLVDPADATLGELSVFGEVDASFGVDAAVGAELSLFVTFDPTSDAVATASGDFSLIDPQTFDELLGGTAQAFGFEEDIIELFFADLTGSLAPSFNDGLLAEIFFLDPLGTEEPFTGLFDGEVYETSVSLTNIAPIPLGTTLPLLLSGLAAIAMLGRRFS